MAQGVSSPASKENQNQGWGGGGGICSYKQDVFLLLLRLADVHGRGRACPTSTCFFDSLFKLPSTVSMSAFSSCLLGQLSPNCGMAGTQASIQVCILDSRPLKAAVKRKL